MHTKSQSNPVRVGSNPVIPTSLRTRNSKDLSCPAAAPCAGRQRPAGCNMAENSKVVGCVLAVVSVSVRGSASSRGSYCSVVVRCCVSVLRFSVLLLLLELYCTWCCLRCGYSRMEGSSVSACCCWFVDVASLQYSCTKGNKTGWKWDDLPKKDFFPKQTGFIPLREGFGW